MFTNLNFVSATIAIVAIMLGCVSANAQVPAPSPTPRNQTTRRPAPEPTAKPQNQSIVNTTKSNVKDHRVLTPSPTPTSNPQNQSIVNTTKSNVKDLAVPAPASTPKRPRDRADADKGWDGKVQGKQVEGRPPAPKPTPTPQEPSALNAPRSWIRVGANNEAVMIFLDLPKPEAVAYKIATGAIEPASGDIQAIVNPIPGIGVVVKKNPGSGASLAVPIPDGKGQLPSKAEAGHYDLVVQIPQASLAGNASGANGVTITIALLKTPEGWQKGAGGPKVAGFKPVSPSSTSTPPPRDQSASNAASGTIRVGANKETVMIFLDLPKPEAFAYNLATGEIAPTSSGAAMTAGLPIPGVGVVVRKHPGGHSMTVPVSDGKGQLPDKMEVGNYDLIVQLPQADGKEVTITFALAKTPDGLVHKKGAGSPKVAGFKNAMAVSSPAPTARDQATGANVQDKQLVTPVKLTFEKPEDYDNFAAGKLKLNLVLKNTLSGQTIRLDSRQLSENFQPGADKKEITVNVVIDSVSAPLSEAACVQAKPTAENMADGSGVRITLSYSGCDSATAQRMETTGAPIGGIVVKGGKNPGGNLSIAPGSTRSVTKEAAAALVLGPGTVVTHSNKGAGSPKQAGF